MTTYISTRPAALPAFPLLDIGYVDSAAKQRAEQYLEQTVAPELEKLDIRTQATKRPGLIADACLTDRAYAELVVETARQNEALQAAGAPLEYIVNRVRIGHGQAVMNSQLLRSGAFSRPALETLLPVVADRSCYSIELGGVSPDQDHLDALLFATSRIEQKPSLELGVPVSFTSNQFLSTLGWAVNKDSYERMHRVLLELETIRLTFHDRSRPKDGKTHISRLLADVARPHSDATVQRWTVILSGNLFRIFDVGRNSIIDLDARAAIRGDFGRWLHGFLSSQKSGLERSYDAQQLCRAGGLRSARLTDDLKQLRANLKLLEAGGVSARRARKDFEPVLEPGWSLTKDPRSGRYVLRAMRSG